MQESRRMRRKREESYLTKGTRKKKDNKEVRFFSTKGHPREVVTAEARRHDPPRLLHVHYSIFLLTKTKGTSGLILTLIYIGHEKKLNQKPFVKKDYSLAVECDENRRII